MTVLIAGLCCFICGYIGYFIGYAKAMKYCSDRLTETLDASH